MLPNCPNTAQPCTPDGLPICLGAPPPPRPSDIDWSSFDNGLAFKFAHLEFVQKKSLQEAINGTLCYWAKTTEEKFGHKYSQFKDVDHMYSTIDKILYGNTQWLTFEVWYNGLDANNPCTPEWKQAVHTVYACNSCQDLFNMTSSS